jgi:3-oxoacyl-[acyl-carrier protein] reductase
MKVIRGRKALVTGAASGIGRALALALARAGADLYLVDIDAAGLASTACEAERHGGVVQLMACDLREPVQITTTVAAMRATFGALHILVNNAGLAYYGATHTMTAAQWDALLAVNLLAPAQLIRELLPDLAAQDEGHILNVCSIFGLLPLRKGAAYQSTKFGLVGLSRALRAEYGRASFGVTALCPAFVRTPMIDSGAAIAPGQEPHTVPAWASTTPEAVAAAALRALRRNQGVVVIPKMARVLWGLARHSPDFIDWLAREGWRRKGPIDIPPR